jgi:hypothetical protein
MCGLLWVHNVLHLLCLLILLALGQSICAAEMHMSGSTAEDAQYHANSEPFGAV